MTFTSEISGGCFEGPSRVPLEFRLGDNGGREGTRRTVPVPASHGEPWLFRGEVIVSARSLVMNTPRCAIRKWPRRARSSAAGGIRRPSPVANETWERGQVRVAASNVAFLTWTRVRTGIERPRGLERAWRTRPRSTESTSIRVYQTAGSSRFLPPAFRRFSH